MNKESSLNNSILATTKLIQSILNDNLNINELNIKDYVDLISKFLIISLLEDNNLIFNQKLITQEYNYQKYSPSYIINNINEFEEFEIWENIKELIYFTNNENDFEINRLNILNPLKSEFKNYKIKNYSIIEILQLINKYKLDFDTVNYISEQLLDLKLEIVKNKITINDNQLSNRKSQGSYYTPSNLIDYLIDNSLKPIICNVKSVEELLNIKVLDPSCGSGNFLITVAKELFKFSQSLNFKLYKSDLNISTIIENCIFGVDIDPIAIQLSKTAFTLLANKPLNLNIKLGNALIGFAPNRFINTLNENSLNQKCLELMKSNDQNDINKYKFFHWNINFPNNSEFNLIIGNPPWISHVGRAAQKLDDKIKNYYECVFPAFKKYKTTHGLFISYLPNLLKENGILALIIPSSVAELNGYEPVRIEHNKLNTVQNELVDFQQQFKNVTQPCVALISKKIKSISNTNTWTIQRNDLSNQEKLLINKLNKLPKLPESIFAEKGLQSSKKNFSSVNSNIFNIPVRHGSSIKEFITLPPSLFTDKINSNSDFILVDVIIRQTAKFPIAALSDKLPFRNSLIAAFENNQYSKYVLVALLNSSLIRFLHFNNFQDARQTIMPQVKLSHLRSIPKPINNVEELHQLALHQHNNKLFNINDINKVVFKLYNLSIEEINIIKSWAMSNIKNN